MSARWMREPDIRLRPIPELSCCLVYRRRPPALCGLNLTSWLVLTLCDGQDDDALARAYREAVGEIGPGAGRNALEVALRQLEDLGLAQRTPEETP